MNWNNFWQIKLLLAIWQLVQNISGSKILIFQMAGVCVVLGSVREGRMGLRIAKYDANYAGTMNIRRMVKWSSSFSWCKSFFLPGWSQNSWKRREPNQRCSTPSKLEHPCLHSHSILWQEIDFWSSICQVYISCVAEGPESGPTVDVGYTQSDPRKSRVGERYLSKVNKIVHNFVLCRFVIVTAEYNCSLPPALTNLLDYFPPASFR